MQKIKPMEVPKREKLDLSKWVEEKMGRWGSWPGPLAEWDWNEKERNVIGSWRMMLGMT